MDVILLERIAKLGQIGEVVRVRDGFARNFLLPQGKALRATEANRGKFESMKAQLEARNLEKKSEAEAVAKKLDGQTFVVIRQAGEGGQLYGSVSARDIAQAIKESGVSIERKHVMLDAPIKAIGLYEARIMPHPEVSVAVRINVARSEEEAEITAQRGILGPAQAETGERRRPSAALTEEAVAEQEAPAESGTEGEAGAGAPEEG